MRNRHHGYFYRRKLKITLLVKTPLQDFIRLPAVSLYQSGSEHCVENMGAWRGRRAPFCEPRAAKFLSARLFAPVSLSLTELVLILSLTHVISLPGRLTEKISTGNEQSARHHVHCEQYLVNSVESARDLNSERLSRESRGTKAPSSSSRLRRSPLKSRALSTDCEKKRGTALSQGTLGI